MAKVIPLSTFPSHAKGNRKAMPAAKKRKAASPHTPRQSQRLAAKRLLTPATPVPVRTRPIQPQKRKCVRVLFPSPPPTAGQ